MAANTCQTGRNGIDDPPPSYELLDQSTQTTVAPAAPTTTIGATTASDETAPRATRAADTAGGRTGAGLTTGIIRVIRDKKTISLVPVCTPARDAVMTITLKPTFSLSKPDMTFLRGGPPPPSPPPPPEVARSGSSSTTEAADNTSNDKEDTGSVGGQRNSDAAPVRTITLGKAVFHDISSSKADVTIGSSEFKMKKTYASLAGLGWCRWGRDGEGDTDKNFYLMAHCTVTDKAENKNEKRAKKREKEKVKKDKRKRAKKQATSSSSDSEPESAPDDRVPTRDDLTGGVRVAEYHSSNSMGGVRTRQSITQRGFSKGFRHVAKAAVGDYREDRIVILVDGLSAAQREEVLITAVVERERRKRADDEANSIVEEVLMGVLL
ncbi:hypothetical protein Micbo1qcDRAFT_178567 [Microdochium bolleyi]|uniref:Uncharacterized protein n=1 Tax=Microdochium bolleyi TaxID=196109 RepID=A0A136ISQ4_9PEZI|nr:hypothetical protein Micbo1qcDRAFT_178567 [Microdochium bolleyi]